MSKGKRIYIGLDSLLDLRMGVLNILDTEFATEVTSNQSYYKRELDEFQGTKGIINKEQYNSILAKYPDVVLRSSIKTKIGTFLLPLISKFIKESMTAPVDNDISIDVNIYPFTFSDEEAKELVNVLNVTLSNVIRINIVNISIKNLTVDYVKNNYRFMFMYEYHTWMNIHSEHIKASPLRNVLFYVPMIYFNNKPTEEHFKELNRINKTPFEYTQQNLSPLISIDYLPIYLYCVDGPHNTISNVYDTADM